VDFITLLGDAQVSGRIARHLEGVTRRVLVYVLLVNVAAFGCAAALIAVGRAGGDWLVVGALAVVSAYGERTHISLGRNLTVSISLLPAVFAAVLFGPVAAMVVYATSAPFMNWPLLGRVSYFGTRALTGAAAAIAVLVVNSAMAEGPGRTIVSAAAAAFIADLADANFASAAYRLRGNGSWKEAMGASVPVLIASVPFYSSAVAVLALAYQHLSAWTLPLFFAPAMAAQRWFLLYQDQRRLTDDLRAANTQLLSANLSFAKGLIATLDARDRYTAGHSAAVATYAKDIAIRMDLDPEQQELAYLCGLVHDIGKIGLPAGLLEKPGALTLDERREMQRHSEIGEHILANVDTYVEIAAIVRHHHERVDGQGYPDGLTHEQIPLLSRIIAVADAYNAMTSDRPYRDAMPSRVARLRLAQAVESQFDTSVVAAFEAILAAASEEYRTADGEAFRLEAPDRGHRPADLRVATA
jgi:putative nucleotidyltransferase with HDIG domain